MKFIHRSPRLMCASSWIKTALSFSLDRFSSNDAGIKITGLNNLQAAGLSIFFESRSSILLLTPTCCRHFLNVSHKRPLAESLCARRLLTNKNLRKSNTENTDIPEPQMRKTIACQVIGKISFAIFFFEFFKVIKEVFRPLTNTLTSFLSEEKPFFSF